ncbi:PREDICTED: probable elongator complex protein 2 [Ceratosolen solmsi marchali]|uniref:Elongator complex protein 2 n=1 Tax=Ceratosolen solmsi marchali TaxID=326594 RepID=A0AAJ6YW69_9HYME|nr:PREDICTED: probable elongator complex protein 2 [Ceratosolen solmsi marchali]
MIKTNYISAACNQLSHAADWGRNNLICYASNHAIVIYDTKVNKFGSILSTLHEHHDRVNAVHWIRPEFPELETEFISASSDGTAIVWKANNQAKGSFTVANTIKINEPVNMCDAVYINSNLPDLLICTSTVSGDFKIWLRIDKHEIQAFCTIDFFSKLPTTARLAMVPRKFKDSAIPLLIVGLEDSTVVLLSTEMNSREIIQGQIGQFVRVQTLEGHEDWVTSIDYIFIDPQNLFIATGSQDNSIRVWKIITCEPEICPNHEIFQYPKQQTFVVCHVKYEIILESILHGHDAWIYEVHWHPPIEINGTYSQPTKLLSCSLDKTAVIWEPNNATGIWSETVRVGEVGGNSLGFFGCKFSPDGKNFLTHGYHGSFHMWKYDEDSQNWKPRTAPTGHCNSVVDLCWDAKGRFLITASTDQTTRIHAPWMQENGEESWFEIGRPQIHGYDMSCLAILTPCMFASGAEEKVVRIFTAPIIFMKFLEQITDDVNDFDVSVMIEGASVPALGLTNKAILDMEPYNVNAHNKKSENYCKDINYKEPPLEENLVESTLWPELQKLYGHGYEIFSMAARHDGKLLATASKSTLPEHAAIILWNTKTWSQEQQLSSHQLTVTQLAFSPDDMYLLSVSRDRRWSLFHYKNLKYELLITSPKQDKLHTRIIWCCAWTQDSKYFATGSRDGKIGFWSTNMNIDLQPTPVTHPIVNQNSVTALAFAPTRVQDKLAYILAIGYETGCIEIGKIQLANNKDALSWVQIAFLNSSQAHHLTLRRLAFRPIHKSQPKNVIQLASCGSDSIVKIHSILLN